MRADWCGFGLDELGREIRAALAQQSKDGDAADVVAQTSEAAQLQEAATTEARARWIGALRARGDQRSLAMAELLATKADQADADHAARARLQGLAQRSSDPFVTALALLRPCELGQCQNVDPAQWSRLEPANVQAWLALSAAAPGRPIGGIGFDYVLDRLAAEARYSRSYSTEAHRLVGEVMRADVEGLDLWGEFAAFMELQAGWYIASYRPLIEACKQTAQRPGPRSTRCAAIAEAIWHGDDLFARVIAIVLARESVPADSLARRSWEQRARQTEALRAHSSQASTDWLGDVFDWEQPGAKQCQAMRETRRRMLERFQLDEWERMQADFKAAGAGIEEWSAKWQAKNNRSAPDPGPRGSAPR